MKNKFTLVVGLLLFALTYFHVKRQNTYLSNQPAPDAATAVQESPVKTFTTTMKNPLVFHLASN